MELMKEVDSFKALNEKLREENDSLKMDNDQLREKLEICRQASTELNGAPPPTSQEYVGGNVYYDSGTNIRIILKPDNIQTTHALDYYTKIMLSYYATRWSAVTWLFVQTT